MTSYVLPFLPHTSHLPQTVSVLTLWIQHHWPNLQVGKGFPECTATCASRASAGLVEPGSWLHPSFHPSHFAQAHGQCVTGHQLITGPLGLESTLPCRFSALPWTGMRLRRGDTTDCQPDNRAKGLTVVTSFKQYPYEVGTTDFYIVHRNLQTQSERLPLKSTEWAGVRTQQHGEIFYT